VGRLGADETLTILRAHSERRPHETSEFAKRCTPEQRAEAQRLIHRLRCLRRDVLTPGWAQDYDSHLGPSQSSAQTAVDAALFQDHSEERAVDARRVAPRLPIHEVVRV
jgi:hypothetical protein